MLIDSHAHLPYNRTDAQKIVENALTEGVTKIITVGTSLSDSEHAVEMTKWFDNVYATVGVYPHEELTTEIDVIERELERILLNNRKSLSNTQTNQNTLNSKIVAIGECGIDITNWANQRPVQQQIQLFETQIKLAQKYNLPIVIHNRNGNTQVIDLLEKYYGNRKNTAKNNSVTGEQTDNQQNTSVAQSLTTGVAHCFDGTWEHAQQYLDLGFFISFSGFITHNSKKYLHETVKNVPLDKFLIETDSPYILPKGLDPATTKKNEPKNVKMIARKVSEIKELPIDEICKHSFANTCTLFTI